MLRGLSSGLACLLVIALAPTAAHAQQLLTSQKTVEPKWDEVLVEEGSEEDVDEEVV